MMSDIATVMWKERKSLLRQGRNRNRALFNLAFTLVLLAVVFPLQAGEDWTSGWFSVIGAIVLPLILVGTIIPDSIAGERERHTLEALLASRLPDTAILLGKLAAAVIYAWVMTIGAFFLSLFVSNAVSWTGSFRFFNFVPAMSILIVSLLVAVLVGSTGVFVSLRAETVQSAQQTLVTSFLAPFLVLGFVPLIVINVNHDLFTRFVDSFAGLGGGTLLVVGALVLLVADAFVMAAAVRRFKRARLVAGG